MLHNTLSDGAGPPAAPLISQNRGVGFGSAAGFAAGGHAFEARV
jgi:hypothetical protein